MASFSELLMYLPGAVVFLVGSGQTRSWIRQLRGTEKTDGVVTSCEHVVKKDKKDRDVYNYFDVTVSYQNTETGKNEKEVFKSPTEYALKQPVKVYRGSDGKMIITEKVDEEIFHPLAMPGEHCGGHGSPVRFAGFCRRGLDLELYQTEADAHGAGPG